jgi:hypothetical protein
MPAWLFQTVDRNRIELIERGYMDRWCVRRYRRQMQRNDVVFVWLGGSPTVRGVHGWGKLAAAPYPDGQAFFVDVRYDQRARPFLPVIALRSHPVLHTLPILHMPRATNFRLATEQAAALADLLNMPINA